MCVIFSFFFLKVDLQLIFFILVEHSFFSSLTLASFFFFIYSTLKFLRVFSFHLLPVKNSNQLYYATLLDISVAREITSSAPISKTRINKCTFFFNNSNNIFLFLFPSIRLNLSHSSQTPLNISKVSKEQKPRKRLEKEKTYFLYDL